MQLQNAVNIADLRLLAKRRLPRVMFDLLDGASEDERALSMNLARLREHALYRSNHVQLALWLLLLV